MAEENGDRKKVGIIIANNSWSSGTRDDVCIPERD